MVSSSSARDASAPLRITSAGETSARVNGSPMVSVFWVRVPVLSEHRTSTPASSSMATSRVTIACLSASSQAPTAIVTDRTVGMATGMAATVRTSANWRVSATGSPRRIETMTITVTRATASRMRNFPICRTACWKWLTVAASWTSSAVLPK